MNNLGAPLCFIFSLLAAISFSACSPKHIFLLETNHEDKTVYQGMEYLFSKQENSSVILAYYRHLDDSIIMDLEMINEADSVIRVDASDFHYKAYKNIHFVNTETDSIEWNEKLIVEGTAFDPEETILEIDMLTSKAEAKERTNKVLDAIRTQDAAERAERRENFYRYASSLNQQRQYWETETLRKTDLFPGESIAGEIHFPVVEEAHFFEFLIHAGGDEHRFIYQQRRFAP